MASATVHGLVMRDAQIPTKADMLSRLAVRHPSVCGVLCRTYPTRGEVPCIDLSAQPRRLSPGPKARSAPSDSTRFASPP